MFEGQSVCVLAVLGGLAAASEIAASKVMFRTQSLKANLVDVTSECGLCGWTPAWQFRSLLEPPWV